MNLEAITAMGEENFDSENSSEEEEMHDNYDSIKDTKKRSADDLNTKENINEPTEAKSSKSARQRKGKYTLPTLEEQSQLRETEKILRSNLVRMEMGELLSEIRFESSKSSTERIEGWLFSLKEKLESLEQIFVDEQSLRIQGVHLSHRTQKVVSLDFKAPSKFNLVGSYLPGALSKPGLNIDVSMEIPSSCFLPKDILNFRYFDKRMLFVGHIAKELESWELVKSVKLAYFRGDTRKPVILLEPALKTKFVVRLLPSIPDGVFSTSRFSPSRSNARRKRAGPENVEAELVPTPHYTSAVVEDMGFHRHLTMIHNATASCPVLTDAIVLAKVWLAQRGMRSSFDGLNGFTVSMILVYLFQTRQINARTDVQHAFQVLLKFLASEALGSTVLSLDALEGDIDIAAGEEELYKSAFDCVLLDRGIGLNVLSRVSASALVEVREEAALCLKLLTEQNESASATGHSLFSKVFLTKVSFWAKYDSFVQVPILSFEDGAAFDGKLDQFVKSEDESLCDFSLWEFISRKTTKILKQALGDRAPVVRCIGGIDIEDNRSHSGACCYSWGLSDTTPASPDGSKALSFGLRLNPEHYGRRVDRGPPAEDAAAALLFRDFWGERAELRRFKDGSIVEAVVWKTAAGAVVEEICKFALMRHDPIRCTKAGAVVFLGNQLDEIVAEPSSLDSGDTGKIVAEGNATRTAIAAFDALSNRLRNLNGLPLQVESILSSSPALRYTSALPPSQSPLAGASSEVVKAFQGKQVSTQLDVLGMYLKFESSSRWPDDSAAVARTTDAFLVRIAQCLSEQHRMQLVKPGTDAEGTFLDILSGGYAFRLRIVPPHQEIKRLQVSEDPLDQRQYKELQLSYILGTLHHSTLHGFHSRFPMFAPVVRLALVWLNGHGFAGHFRIEAIELLAASLFCSPAPFPCPCSLYSGFLRFLLLLGYNDWESNPIVVDLFQDMTSDDRIQIQSTFEDLREKQPGQCPIFVVASYLKEYNWCSTWTMDYPENVVLYRMKAVAQRSANEIMSWMTNYCPVKKMSKLKKVFHMSPQEVETFDVRISLYEAALLSPEPFKSIKDLMGKRDQGCKLFRTKFYKNVTLKSIMSEAFFGFDHVSDYVKELKKRFEHLALFFFDAIVPNGVYVVWKPQSMLPRCFSVMESAYSNIVQLDDSTSIHVTPNVPEIVFEFKHLGQDIIADVLMK